MAYRRSVSFAALIAISSSTSFAAEGGSGVYLLGARGQGAGITPPPELFLSSQTVIYDGSAAASIPLESGDIGVGVAANPVVEIPTLLWVTDASILGGNLGFSASVPFGLMDIKATVGPFALHEDVLTLADPSIGAFVG